MKQQPRRQVQTKRFAPSEFIAPYHLFSQPLTLLSSRSRQRPHKLLDNPFVSLQMQMHQAQARAVKMSQTGLMKSLSSQSAASLMRDQHQQALGNKPETCMNPRLQMWRLRDWVADQLKPVMEELQGILSPRMAFCIWGRDTALFKYSLSGSICSSPEDVSCDVCRCGGSGTG